MKLREATNARGFWFFHPPLIFLVRHWWMDHQCGIAASNRTAGNEYRDRFAALGEVRYSVNDMALVICGWMGGDEDAWPAFVQP